jgi:N4-(beta-N-acetylglucosaminyl)-L-asparaginase
MGKKVSRREFVKAGTTAGAMAAGAGAAFGQAPAAGQTPAAAQAPAVIAPGGKVVVISSANGNKFKNGGARTAVEEAYQRIVKGEDVLDALIAGVNIVELDPEDDSVGYGGLPNAEGVVQLDASCMHGPRRRAGGVAAIEGVRTPSTVARAVMDSTDHHLIVGEGAQKFARQMGFNVEADLNTPKSRAAWLEWKRRIDPDHYPTPGARQEVLRKVTLDMIRDGWIDPHHLWGTINCNGVNAKGDVCGVTTTSGLSFKIPGRVGDSPILGAGLWVDGEVGAAGSTGRGEANLFNLSSRLIVEEMRRGRHPKDAAMEALKRINANTVEKRLLDDRGRPNFYVTFYVLDRSGRYACVDLYTTWHGRPRQFALCTENGPQTLAADGLLGDGPAS